MIKNHILIIAISLMMLSLSAKDRLIYGYYISNNNDTVDCRLYIPFYETKSGMPKIEFKAIQNGLVARTKEGDKIKIKPEVFKGFGFAYEYNQFEYNSYTISDKSKDDMIFLRTEIKGKLSMLTYFLKIPIITGNTPYGISLNIPDVRYVRHYLQKDDNSIIKYDKALFEDGLNKLIFDYPELQEKLGKVNYEYDNIIRIVMEYDEFFD